MIEPETAYNGPITRAEVLTIVRNRMNGYKPNEGQALRMALYIVELCRKYGIADERFSEEEAEDVPF